MLLKLKTFYRLGILNLVRVVSYRIGIKLGLNPVKKIQSEVLDGVFFLPYTGMPKGLKANQQWIDNHCYFGQIKTSSKEVPDWHLNCLNGNRVKYPQRPWYSIADFDPEVGDIKGVWEASRLDWVLTLAQQGANGDESRLSQLNSWLQDWNKHNPCYLGANWKCGQEASIRVLHLAMAAKILKQTHHSSNALLALIKAHLKRISPTMMYAVAQDNNHGTSEAAALFVGGSWLMQNGDADGEKWYAKGRRWLEERAEKLIDKDGTFSQYSINYHRVMLDTYSMAEVWRRYLGLPEFSKKLNHRLQKSALWLYQMVDADSGDAPNLGANDGARLLPLVESDYRDFRPSVQLASTLFLKQCAYQQNADYDLALQWLDVKKPEDKISEQVALNNYGMVQSADAKVILVHPRFRFRPSQCDVLHLDFWVRGKNVLRDGGTYSYNAGNNHIEYYGGTQSHNTVQFDEYQQMPRLSRFLLGSWINAKVEAKHNNTVIQAEYTDRHGATHQREVSLHAEKLIIKDNVFGFKNSAVLRWRLCPGEWVLDGNTLTGENLKMRILATSKISRIELTKGKESRFYFQEKQIPVLEIEVIKDSEIITELIF